MSNELTIITREDLSVDIQKKIDSLLERKKVITALLSDKTLFQEGRHFGVPFGKEKNEKTGKWDDKYQPALLKAGAEFIMSLLGIRIPPQGIQTTRTVENNDKVNYSVIVTGFDGEGNPLSSGAGSANTYEEKYKWRKALSEEEFKSFPIEQRRMKFKRGKNNSTYQEQQVRMDSDSLENTVYKMALKRATVAMVLNVTGCSDMFSQDLEDMSAETLRAFANAGNNENDEDTAREDDRTAAAALFNFGKSCGLTWEFMRDIAREITGNKELISLEGLSLEHAKAIREHFQAIAAQAQKKDAPAAPVPEEKEAPKEGTKGKLASAKQIKEIVALAQKKGYTLTKNSCDLTEQECFDLKISIGETDDVIK